MVPVRSGAVATSGTAHRGDHLVDPRTGQPPKAIASVTVIEASLTWADIDATGLRSRPRRRRVAANPSHRQRPDHLGRRCGDAHIEDLITSVVTPSKG